MVRQLVTGYQQDDNITQLVDLYDWYIMPVVNPDGYEYSHTTVSSNTVTHSYNRQWSDLIMATAVKTQFSCHGNVDVMTQDRLWRKTRSRTVWRQSRCRGVDANRNFDFHWRGDWNNSF